MSNIPVINSIHNYNGNIGHFEFMQNIKLKQFFRFGSIAYVGKHMLGDISAKKSKIFVPRCGGGGVPNSAKTAIFRHFRLIFRQNLLVENFFKIIFGISALKLVNSNSF